MSEMVERLARAIADLPDLHLVGHGDRERYRATARRALAELQEPTAAMIAATAVKTQPASEADYAVARQAVELTPPRITWTSLICLPS